MDELTDESINGIPQYLSEYGQTFSFQDDLGVELMLVQQFHLLQGTVNM